MATNFDPRYHPLYLDATAVAHDLPWIPRISTCPLAVLALLRTFLDLLATPSTYSPPRRNLSAVGNPSCLCLRPPISSSCRRQALSRASVSARVSARRRVRIPSGLTMSCYQLLPHLRNWPEDSPCLCLRKKARVRVVIRGGFE